MSLPLRIALRSILTVTLVWALATYLPQYISITGGLAAFVIIGALLTLMNLLVRPLLDLALIPLRLFASLLAFLIVNGVFVWLTVWMAARMQPDLVTLHIVGGILGWAIVILLIGIANWLLKMILK
jgi:putative membrane protein